MKKLYVNTDYKFMNWNQDLEKNKSWNNKTYFYFYKFDIENCGDPKFVWEISRLQQLTKLSFFYYLEKKKIEKQKIKII